MIIIPVNGYPELEILAGWQVDGRQPAIPAPEFGFRHAEPVVYLFYNSLLWQRLYWHSTIIARFCAFLLVG